MAGTVVLGLARLDWTWGAVGWAYAGALALAFVSFVLAHVLDSRAASVLTWLALGAALGAALTFTGAVVLVAVVGGT